MIHSGNDVTNCFFSLLCSLNCQLSGASVSGVAWGEMKPSEYSFDLGVGEVTEEGARGNTFNLLPMSVPQQSTAEEKKNMFFWLHHGLVWMYAFNHEEAIKCFQRAIDISPQCIFAYWGVALSHGPNYNTKAMSRDSFPSAKEAYSHAQRVAELLEDATVFDGLDEVEIAILRALSCRFNPVDESAPADVLIKDNTAQYSDALKLVYDSYPGHACIACLYAESLMNFSPWKLWNLESGAPEPHAQKAKDVLDRAIRRFPHHPGLNHFVVHLLEMSPTPQTALPSCDVLRFHFPDAGHLIHMPSHIYVLLGMYDQAATCNLEAIAADEKYVLKEGIYNCYTGYRIHNIHFVSYAAMLSGQFEVAMGAAQQMKKNLPDDLLSNPFMATYFEAFLSIEWHVLIRFGQWEDILSRPILANADSPPEGFLFPYSLAMQHYARGISHAVLCGKDEGSSIAAAEEELTKFRAASRLVPADRVMHNNTCQDLLKVGEAMLLGEIEYRKGTYDHAFEHLRNAVRLSDNLVYDEPWGWMQPPRHALGALLLDQNHIQEAEDCFRKDMDTAFIGRCHPDNIWALSGLTRCLEMHPEEYQITDTTETQPVKSDAKSNSCPSPVASKIENDQKGNGHSVWKQINLKLDWEHIGPNVTPPSFLKPCTRKEEATSLKKKISEIKAVARRKLLLTEGNKSEANHPWLLESVSLAACLCGKTLGQVEEGSSPCCKRQKLK